MPGQVSSDLIYVGSPDRITGAIMAAPKGTPAPTDATTAPDAAFVDSGYITADGVTVSDAQTWTEIEDWGGDIVRRIKSKSAVTVKTSFLELNDRSSVAAFGENNVDITGDQIAIHINVSETPKKLWAINMLDGDRAQRLVLPDAQVTERGDLSFTRSGAVVIPVTIACYPDINGDTVIWYLEGPGSNKGAAGPGDVFTEATVTASDAPNAAKLGPLGYVADPATAWTAGQQITVSGFAFNWSGSAWAAGAHA